MKKVFFLLACALLTMLILGFQPSGITAPSNTQTTTEGKPRGRQVQFNIDLFNFDDCTYSASKNGDIIFRARVRLTRSDGSVSCSINNALAHIDNDNFTGHSNIIRFSSTLEEQNERFIIDIDFVAYPRESPTCFEEPQSCSADMTKCCFDFSCCDCGQWNGVLFEGFWAKERFRHTIPEVINLLSDTRRLNLAHLYPPHAPNPNTTSDSFEGGCECCAH